MKSQQVVSASSVARKRNKLLLVLAAAIGSVLLIAATALPPVKIMLIGDTITQGEGYNYRYMLWNRLLDSGYTNIDFVGNAPWGNYRGGFKWNHESWGGYTTGQVLSSSSADIASIKPDIATVTASRSGRKTLYLKAHASEIVRDISDNRTTYVITLNGASKAVVQDMASFEHTQDSLIMLKMVAQSTNSLQAGRYKPVDKAFKAIASRINKLGLPVRS